MKKCFVAIVFLVTVLLSGPVVWAAVNGPEPQAATKEIQSDAVADTASIGPNSASDSSGNGQERSDKRKKEKRPDGPSVGQTAPDFLLKALDGEKTVSLSALRGKSPVVLVLTSYT